MPLFMQYIMSVTMWLHIDFKQLTASDTGCLNSRHLLCSVYITCAVQCFLLVHYYFVCIFVMFDETHHIRNAVVACSCRAYVLMHLSLTCIMCLCHYSFDWLFSGWARHSCRMMCHVVRTDLTAINYLSSQSHGAHITISAVLLCTCAIMHFTAFQLWCPVNYR